MIEPRVIPTDAVRAVDRFNPDGPRGYIIVPPYGDGTTLYGSRAQAHAALATCPVCHLPVTDEPCQIGAGGCGVGGEAS